MQENEVKVVDSPEVNAIENTQNIPESGNFDVKDVPIETKPEVTEEDIRANFFEGKPLPDQKVEQNPEAKEIEEKVKKYLEDKNKSEKQEDPEKTEETVEKVDSEQKIDEKPKSVQKLKFKWNGEEHEADLDSIASEFPEVLEELKAGVSGRKEAQRRLTDVDKLIKEDKKKLDMERESFYNSMNKVQSYLNGFADKVSVGKVLDGMKYFGDFAGLPAYQLEDRLIQELMPKIKRRLELDQEQVELEYLSEENQYFRELRESEAIQLAEEKRAREEANLRTKLDSLRNTHEIEEKSWNLALKELEKGGLKEPSLDEVVNKAKDIEWSTKSVQICTDIAKEQKLTFSEFEDLKKAVAPYPFFTAQDVQDLVNEYRQEVSAIQDKDVDEKMIKKLSNTEPKKVMTAKEIPDEDLKALRRQFGIG